MKKISNYRFLFFLIAMLLFSCRSDEKDPRKVLLSYLKTNYSFSNSPDQLIFDEKNTPIEIITGLNKYLPKVYFFNMELTSKNHNPEVQVIFAVDMRRTDTSQVVPLWAPWYSRESGAFYELFKNIGVDDGMQSDFKNEFANLFMHFTYKPHVSKSANEKNIYELYFNDNPYGKLNFIFENKKIVKINYIEWKPALTPVDSIS